MNVVEFLREHRAAHSVIEHPAAYSAQRMAQAVHVSGDMVAKSVVLKAGHGCYFYLAVVPATARVDFDKVRAAMGVDKVELASEHEIAEHYHDCELGAMPPFGSRLAMETIIDESVARAEEIVFETNSHSQAIRMKYRDYYALEHPLVVRIATRN